MSIRSFKRAQARREARQVRRARVLARGGRLAAGATLATSVLATGTAHAATTYTVNDGTDRAVDSSNPCSTSGTPGCTLRDALALANSDGGGSTISFDAALNGSTITLTQGSLPVNSRGVTVSGPGASKLTIDGGYRPASGSTPAIAGSQIFVVGAPAAPDSHVTISGLTLTGGDVSGNGGAVYWNPSSNPKPQPLTLVGDVITASHATGNGGGVFSGGALSVSGSTISNDVAGQSGGGIAAQQPRSFGEQAPLTLTDSKVTGNTAGADGGGVNLVEGNKYGSNSTVGHSVISGSTISGNSLDNASNSGYAFGGGVNDSGGTLVITGSTVSGNSAAPVQTDSHQAGKGFGGGIFSSTKYGTEITGSTVSGNTASSGGGGVSVGSENGYPRGVPNTTAQQYQPTTISTTTVSGNNAPDGAGVEVLGLADGSPMTIDRSTISGNSGGAGSYGGGIALDQLIGAPFTLRNSTLSGNSAANGGGISVGNGSGADQFPQKNGETTGSVELENSTIADNQATASGGGVFLDAYDPNARPSTPPGPRVKSQALVVTSSTTTTSSNPTTGATIGLDSTIVATNKANGANNDLARSSAATSGGFVGDFNLVQTPSPLLSGSNPQTGQDPLLSPLGDNGGPTKTMAPAGNSPTIDQGHRANHEAVDQTGNPRTVDTAVPNPVNGDGTDIGAVELPASKVTYRPPTPPPYDPGFRVGIRTTLTLPGSPLGTGIPLLVGSQTPVTCTVQSGTLRTCLIELRIGNKVIASGAATDRVPTKSITSLVELNGVGVKLIKNYPLGVTVPATATTDAFAAQFIDGYVHFLPSNAITLPLVGRTITLSSKLSGQLKQVASLLRQTRTVGCTAYSDKTPTRYRIVGTGRHRHKVALPNPDFALTQAQAKAVCSTLKADGLAAKVSYVGRGYHGEVASDRTQSGRAQNRRVVISFRF